MKAVVYHGPGDIALDQVADPSIEAYQGFDRRDAGWLKTVLAVG